ncbi:hypothetical protein HK096_009726 [Nowakowskiella sp. JEL0078]|nr:hypothetical protein HK096_009726 [Nowakowskiella sp. JEL0078]
MSTTLAHSLSATDLTLLLRTHYKEISSLRTYAIAAFRCLMTDGALPVFTDIDLSDALKSAKLSPSCLESLVSSQDIEDIAEILIDDVFLFRFLKKHNFLVASALPHILAHMSWRIQNDIAKSILPLNALLANNTRVEFFLNEKFYTFVGTDVVGRPVAKIDLRVLSKISTMGGVSNDDVSALRLLLIFAMECSRRLIFAENMEWEKERIRRLRLSNAIKKKSATSPTKPTKTEFYKILKKAEVGVKSFENDSLDHYEVDYDPDDASDEEDLFVPPNVSASAKPLMTFVDSLPPLPLPPLLSERIICQISVFVDLDGVGISSLNTDLIPMLYDLFSRQYPQSIGTVFVTNYSWYHAGIWSIIKTALPASATGKLVFVDSSSIKNLISFSPSETHSKEIKIISNYSKNERQSTTTKTNLSYIELPPAFEKFGTQAFSIEDNSEDSDGSYSNSDTSQDELFKVLETPKVEIAFTENSTPNAKRHKRVSTKISNILSDLDPTSIGFVTASDHSTLASPRSSAELWFDAPTEPIPEDSNMQLPRRRVTSAADLQRLIRSPSSLYQSYASSRGRSLSPFRNLHDCDILGVQRVRSWNPKLKAETVLENSVKVTTTHPDSSTSPSEPKTMGVTVIISTTLVLVAASTALMLWFVSQARNGNGFTRFKHLMTAVGWPRRLAFVSVIVVFGIPIWRLSQSQEIVIIDRKVESEELWMKVDLARTVKRNIFLDFLDSFTDIMSASFGLKFLWRKRVINKNRETSNIAALIAACFVLTAAGGIGFRSMR